MPNSCVCNCRLLQAEFEIQVITTLDGKLTSGM